jgi:hypothetical protein
MQAFLLQYLKVSMRVFAYLAGTLLFAIVGAFAEHVVPTSSIRWLIFFFLNIVEFEIAGAIIARTYHPHFPATLMPGTPEYDTRLASEKMLYQLILFFGFDMVLALCVALLGFHAPSVAYWIWGALGLPFALIHFFGIAMLAAGFYDANTSGARTQAKITGAVFMLPGIVYIGIALSLFLKTL